MSLVDLTLARASLDNARQYVAPFLWLHHEVEERFAELVAAENKATFAAAAERLGAARDAAWFASTAADVLETEFKARKAAMS